MRGQVNQQSSMLMLMSPESLVPTTHPIRRVKALADEALRALSPVFDQMYSKVGRGSIPPERLLKASLLMALYSVRSERLFCEQLGYNLLFRWFFDMDMAEGTFDATVFSKNRSRLLKHDVAGQFFAEVVQQARRARLVSAEHFTVDGTLIEAWASLKSFRRKEEEGQRGAPKDPPDDPGNPEVDFHGEKRSNETHESSTDPESRLARKGNGKEAKLCFSGHSLMENCNGLLVDFRVAEANGRAEREVAIEMIQNLPGGRPITVAADKGYDCQAFVKACRERKATPHVAQKKRYSAIDARTTRHAGYAVSQRLRKRVEEVFGWVKTVGNFRKTRYQGVERTQLAAYLIGAAYNLLRMARLLPEAA